MATDSNFKKIVRARMARTGERYATARRAILEAALGPDSASADPAVLRYIAANPDVAANVRREAGDRLR